MDNNTASANIPLNTNPKAVSKKKIVILFAAGIFVGLSLAFILYLVITKNSKNSEEVNNVTDDTNNSETTYINPESIKYDTFYDEQGRFSLSFPTNAVRVNADDIEKTISDKNLEKYKSDILFVAVLRDKSEMIQIIAETLEFENSKAFSDSYEELINDNQNDNVEIEITELSISDEVLTAQIKTTTGGVIYNSVEKLFIYKKGNDSNEIIAVSVTISEDIFEKYKNLAYYILDSVKIGDSSSVVEIQNSEGEYYLGRFPKNQNAPTDGSGIIATSTFEKNEDQICLVSKLEKGSSGYIIQVLDENSNIISSDTNVSLVSGTMSGCNDISFEAGNYTLKILLNSQLLKEIDFTVN